KYFVFSSSLSRKSVDALRSSSALRHAATIGGATVLENKYGRERCRRRSRISFRPLMNPQLAPPDALPAVPANRAALPTQPRYSCVPLPVLPRKPVACASSIIVSALYLSASSTIGLRSAIVPSIEKQPSVAINRNRASFVARNCAARSAMSLCL